MQDIEKQPQEPNLLACSNFFDGVIKDFENSTQPVFRDCPLFSALKQVRATDDDNPLALDYDVCLVNPKFDNRQEKAEEIRKGLVQQSRKLIFELCQSLYGSDENFQTHSKDFRSLGTWLPPAPSLGANAEMGRTHDFTKYRGTIKSVLESALADLVASGSSPDLCLMDVARWERLLFEEPNVESRPVVFQQDVHKIEFLSIELELDGHVVNVIADPFCQIGQAWLLTSKTLQLRFAGFKLLHILSAGAGEFVRWREWEGQFEFRTAWRSNLMCTAPKSNSRIYMPFADNQSDVFVM